MDGDGDLDVVTVHQNLAQAGGAVAVWRNNGSGAFGTPLVRNVPMPKYDFSGQGVDLELGDLNGDSFVDVVVGDSGDDDLASTLVGRRKRPVGCRRRHFGSSRYAISCHYARRPSG